MFCVMRMAVHLSTYLKWLLFSSTLFLWHVSQTNGLCPSGWHPDNSNCYGVLQGQFNSISDAQEMCLDQGADLAVFPDLTTEQAIYSNAFSGVAVDRAYIGLTDFEEEGTFKWVGNISTSYDNWASDNSALEWPAAENRDCAVAYTQSGSIDTDTSATIKWIQVPCCFNEFNVSTVICEKPESSNSTVNESFGSHCFDGCPTDWVKLDGICYGINSNQTISRVYDAREMCQDMDSDIGHVSDETVADHVAMLARSLSSVPSNFFVSLNNLTSGSYVHGDDVSPGYSGEWMFTYDDNASCVSIESESSTSWNMWLNNTVWRNQLCCEDVGVQHVLCQKPDNDSAPIIPIANNVFAHACDTNDCDPDPCTVGQGTCVDEILDYECTCEAGYTGQHCETDIDECASSPCEHGTCTNLVDEFSCDCDDGWTGETCNEVSDSCLACSPCTAAQFSNCTHVGGNVESCAAAVPGSYECECLNGYSGQQCETDIDECVGIDCLNGGTCLDRIGFYECDCAENYVGDHCGTLVECDEDPLGAPFNASIVDIVGDLSNPLNGDSFVYECIANHKFDDMTTRKTIVCAAGGWNNTNADIQACQPHCAVLPTVSSSSLSDGATTRVGATVNFTCHEGFKLPDNATVFNSTCLTTGNWSHYDEWGYTPQCSVVTCPELPTYANQHLSTDATTYNTTVIFWCSVGHAVYDGTTARSIKCEIDGAWSARLPSCDPIECPAIDLPDQSTRNTSAVTYSTRAKYTCTQGLRMRDGATSRTIKCEATGNWSDTVTACRNERCFPLPYVANATPDSTDAGHGNTTTFTCITGHRFRLGNQPAMQSTCQTNNRWNPLLDSCEPILCPTIVPGANNRPDTNDTLFGTIVNMNCDPGHYYGSPPVSASNSQVMTLECLETGLWDVATVPDCYAIECPLAPDSDNGTRSPVYDATAEFEYGDLIEYTCNSGHKFVDGEVTRNMRCEEDGMWTYDDVSCRRERCNQVPAGIHTVPNTTDTEWDTVVQYSCEPGYEWDQNVQITCERTGMWSSNEVGECDITYCDDVPAEPNQSTDTDDNAFGTEVTYECNVGYKYEDESMTTRTRRCNETQQWEPAVLDQCHIIHCPELESVVNASRNSNDTFYNNIVTYTCDDGYQFPESTREVKIFENNVTCQANGEWTEYPNDCEVLYCMPLPTWNANFNDTSNDFDVYIEYHCLSNMAFRGEDDNSAVRYSHCAVDKRWTPSIEECHETTNFQDVIKKPKEAKNSDSIGTVAMALMIAFVVSIVLLDLNKLMTDLRFMKANIDSLMKHNKDNQIGDSFASVRDPGSSQA